MKKEYNLDELLDAIRQARDTIAKAQTLSLTVADRQRTREALEGQIAELMQRVPALETSVREREQALTKAHTERMDALNQYYQAQRETLATDLQMRTAEHQRAISAYATQDADLRASIVALEAVRDKAAVKLSEVQGAIARTIADGKSFLSLAGA